MLPSCFRSIVHHSFHFRPSLQVASISTTAVRNNNEQDYGELVGVLKKEGEQRKLEEFDDDDPKGFSRVLSDVGLDSSYGTYKEKVRSFLPNRPLHPTEFSRARRIVAPRRQPKKWDLGLPTRKARYNDVFYQLGIDPVDECMNTTLLSHFVSRMGRVQRRAETELTMRSQRRLAKAIKRAKMMGILPTHSQSAGLFRLA